MKIADVMPSMINRRGSRAEYRCSRFATSSQIPISALPVLDTRPARYQPVMSKMIKIEPVIITMPPTVAAAMPTRLHTVVRGEIHSQARAMLNRPTRPLATSFAVPKGPPTA